MNYEYVKKTLLGERWKLTQDSDWIAQEVKTYRNAIADAENYNVNDLSDSAMQVAMNMEYYRNKLALFESSLDETLENIREIDSAIAVLSGGDNDV